MPYRSEEHTSELQSHDNLVCRLLLEKKTRHSRRSAPPPAPPPPPRPPHPRHLTRRARLGPRSTRGRAPALSAPVGCFFFERPAPPGARAPPPPPALYR